MTMTDAIHPCNQSCCWAFTCCDATWDGYESEADALRALGYHQAEEHVA